MGIKFSSLHKVTQIAVFFGGFGVITGCTIGQSGANEVGTTLGGIIGEVLVVGAGNKADKDRRREEDKQLAQEQLEQERESALEKESECENYMMSGGWASDVVLSPTQLSKLCKNAKDPNRTRYCFDHYSKQYSPDDAIAQCDADEATNPTNPPVIIPQKDNTTTTQSGTAIHD